MLKIGFDNEKYLAEQSAAIIERASHFGDKLYLEFGGKLICDYHAARVLPGFDPDCKIKLLQRLKDKIDIIICIYAGAIEEKKVRADFGLSYDADTLKTIDDLHDWGLNVKAVVVTRYRAQPCVKVFIRRLQRQGIKVYTHRPINGYPGDIDTIVSPAGYGANSYIETDKPIVVVTGPGPNSGKMATCLSQVYHDYQHGIKAGYAKFETFPVWNLSVSHPVNRAYEAATADIGDKNLVDTYQYEATKEITTNYNRDLEIFPVVRHICSRIMPPEQLYVSPTAMGVNRIQSAIIDDEAVRYAATQEIIRRYFNEMCKFAKGEVDQMVPGSIKLILNDMGVSELDRKVVAPARKAAEEAAKEPGKGDKGSFCGAAIELADGTIITGKNSTLLRASTCCIINAIKYLAKLPGDLDLLPPQVIESMGILKRDIMREKSVSLTISEALTALCVSTPSNPVAALAISKVHELRGCEMHISHMPSSSDEIGLRKLGLNYTSEPVYTNRNLFLE